MNRLNRLIEKINLPKFKRAHLKLLVPFLVIFVGIGGVIIVRYFSQKAIQYLPKAEETADRCSVDIEVIEDTPTPSLALTATPTITPSPSNTPTPIATITPSFTSTPMATPILTSPSCDNLAISLTTDKKIKADFTLSGKNSPLAKMVAGVFYRIHDDINSPSSNWIQMGELSSEKGDSKGVTLNRLSEPVQSGLTYEVAGSINVFYDINPINGKYDVGEPRDICSGKVGTDVWENNDCPTKDNCFKSIIVQ